MRAVLEGGVGVSLLAGGVLIGIRREWRAVEAAIVALVVNLTVVDLMVFYQDVFAAALRQAAADGSFVERTSA